MKKLKFPKHRVSFHKIYKDYKLKVIITVPHNICKDGTNLFDLTFKESLEKKKNLVHECDFMASQAAKLIAKFVGKENTEIFFATVSRKECQKCDLNRKNRKLGFRPKLRKYVFEKIFTERLFVLDVHSYPPTYKKTRDLDCYLLDDDYPFKKYSIKFVEFMKKSGVKIKILRGKNNDIMDEMREFGIPCFLIEVNERLNKKELTEICELISKWLNKQYF